jgi:hypothetical protein
MFSLCSNQAMDNRINEIRRKMSALRAEMARVEDAMRDQIKRDLDCTDSASRLMALRTEMVGLIAEWKAAGGSEPLPTIQERLSANNRPAERPKTALRH